MGPILIIKMEGPVVPGNPIFQAAVDLVGSPVLIMAPLAILMHSVAAMAAVAALVGMPA